MGLWDKALPGERDGLAALNKSWEAAKAQTTEHTAERDRLVAERYRVAGGAKQNARAVATAHLHGETLAPRTTGRSRAELDQLVDGMNEIIREDERNETEALGALQARTLEVVKACVERCAQDYLEHSARLAAAHAQIGGAQKFVRTLAGDARADLVDPEEFERLYVPSAQGIQALRGYGIETQPHWHVRVLAGGERGICNEAACHAVDALEADLLELFGGRWPFKRYASGDYATTAAMARGEADEAARKSRRAVIAEAAERILP